MGRFVTPSASSEGNLSIFPTIDSPTVNWVRALPDLGGGRAELISGPENKLVRSVAEQYHGDIAWQQI